MKNGKIILLVIGLIVLVTGTTYAIYTWRGKSVIKGDFECLDVIIFFSIHSEVSFHIFYNNFIINKT